MSTSPTLSGYKRPPKYFKLEAKPADASTKDLKNAQPIYIDGLPDAGEPGVSQAAFDALVQRVAALEAAPAG